MNDGRVGMSGAFLQTSSHVLDMECLCRTTRPMLLQVRKRLARSRG